VRSPRRVAARPASGLTARAFHSVAARMSNSAGSIAFARATRGLLQPFQLPWMIPVINLKP